ncbi:hypothetical protein GOBAR_AA22960 [Gossypium barbadense]|uniref:Uncharacterized protein n=1 Tax=Gossypium barbadense TaxID=3634 RepID=A0A2P5X307_GOSBA|nr:hypothetical protein GOBAR_AA22960 [Gossypium barbadense]
MSLKEVHEPFSSNSRGPIHEERKLQIKELDEWRTHKLRTHDKSKLYQNKLNTVPNQLKVGDKVLLDAADPHIVTTKPNEEIPLMVLSIFAFGTIECLTPNLLTELLNIGLPHRHGQAHGLAEDRAEIGKRFSPARVYHVIFTRKESCRPCFEEKEAVIFLRSYPKNSSPFPAVPHWAQRRTFPDSTGPTLGKENELHALNRHIHHSPSWCWNALTPDAASYNPSRSKASALPPSLMYLQAILAHTLTGMRESTGIVNTHEAYFLWCMSHGHVINLAYLISLAIQHQTEWHKKGVISIGPYVTRLARYFGLLNIAAQSSSLTLMGQMSPQGISSMLSMRMIEKRCDTFPPQYRLPQSTEEEAPEDNTDDVSPRHEDLPSQPPPLSRPVHAAASFTDISERLTRFEQQCFQRFDNIDELKTPPGKVLHDCHILLDHDHSYN